MIATACPAADAGSGPRFAEEESQPMQEITVGLYQVHDFELRSRTAHDNPFRVPVSATFQHESGAVINDLEGFYDGGDVWRIRFSPNRQGLWRGATRGDDPQLDGIELPAVRCVPNDNPAVHGMMRVDPQAPHRFVFEDGTPAVPLGFEWDWMFAYHQEHGQGRSSSRDNPPFEEAMDLICRSGFNYIVANLYAHLYHRNETNPQTEPYLYRPPKMWPFGGSNDQPDHSRLNVEFFQDFDRMVAQLHRRGVLLHLMIQVQNKKVNWPDRASAEDDVFWRYVVARYQGFCNVIWDVSKESYNLLARTGGHDYTLSRIGLIRRSDAYGHLVTAHDNERESWGAVSVVDKAADFIADQVKFGGAEANWAVQSAHKLNREAVRRWRRAAKPYMNVEYGYELGVEPLSVPSVKFSTSGENILLWTWALYVAGAYPNYYYCNTSWDLIKFHPIPPSWPCYRHLADFLGLMDLRNMAPDNDLVQGGMCSAEPGKQYFVLLPAGGDESIDLTAVPKGAGVQATWIDITGGQQVSQAVEDWGFSVKLANPLAQPDRPCAIYLKVR